MLFRSPVAEPWPLVILYAALIGASLPVIPMSRYMSRWVKEHEEP